MIKDDEILDDANPSVGGQLQLMPADLWAKIYELLPHEDLLRCCTLNLFFLRQVCPLVSRLFVSPTASQNALIYFPSHRFPKISDIFLYNVVPDTDVTALSLVNHDRVMLSIVPFLCSFSGLRYAFLGGLRWFPLYNKDLIRVDNPACRCSNLALHDPPNTANALRKHERLVESICSAYNQGRLRSTVFIDGALIRAQDSSPTSPCIVPEQCHWRGNQESCRYCRRICTFFPVLQVVNLTNHNVPCLSEKERMDIALQRDAHLVHQHATDSFIKALSDQDRQAEHLLSYDHNLEKLRLLAANGANVRDPRVRETVYSFPASMRSLIPGGPSRGMTIQTFDGLSRLGVDISEADFQIFKPDDVWKRLCDETVEFKLLDIMRDLMLDSDCNNNGKHLDTIRVLFKDHTSYPFPGPELVGKMLQEALQCDVANRWAIMEILSTLFQEKLITGSIFEEALSSIIEYIEADFSMRHNDEPRVFIASFFAFFEHLHVILSHFLHLGAINVTWMSHQLSKIGTGRPKTSRDTAYRVAVKVVIDTIGYMNAVFGRGETVKHFGRSSKLALEVLLGTDKWNSIRSDMLY